MEGRKPPVVLRIDPYLHAVREAFSQSPSCCKRCARQGVSRQTFRPLRCQKHLLKREIGQNSPPQTYESRNQMSRPAVPAHPGQPLSTICEDWALPSAPARLCDLSAAYRRRSVLRLPHVQRRYCALMRTISPVLFRSTCSSVLKLAFSRFVSSKRCPERASASGGENGCCFPLRTALRFAT